MNFVTCTRGLKDAQCGAGERDSSEHGRNFAGADTCSIASLR